MADVYVRLTDVPLPIRRRAATWLAKQEPNPIRALELKLAAEHPDRTAGAWVPLDEAFQVCVLGRTTNQEAA